MNRFRHPIVASFTAVVLIAQAGIAAAAGDSRQVAVGSAVSLPAHVAKAGGASSSDAQCEALRQNPDDSSLACQAVRCATGQDPYWSRCTAGGTEHEPLPAK